MAKIKNKKTVALLVLTYNCEKLIKECLGSILNQNYKNFQVFVIDNCSTDKTVFLIKKYYPQVKLIENPKNFGVGKGFNETIKAVLKKFDYICFFNHDVKSEKNCLKELVNTLNNHPEVEICTSLTLDWKGEKVDNAGGTIVNLFSGIISGFLGDLQAKEIPSQYRKDEFPVLFGIATAMLVRPSAFEKFGFYDEDYFMYFEEIDFSWRVVLGGGKILCNPKAIAYHYGHGAKVSKKISLKVLQQTETNLLATYVKNLSLSSLIIVLPVLLFIRLFMSLFYLPISPKITWRKISGIKAFLGKLFSGQYRKQRKFVSRIRKLSDCQVFSLNPTPIVSFKPIFSFMGNWFKTVNKIYKK